MRARSPRPISSRKKIAPLIGNNTTSHSALVERFPGRRAAEADVQEEADEEQLLEAPQHVRELLRALVIREHRAEQQRAELGAQAERLERLRRRRSRARRRTAPGARRGRSVRAARRSPGRANGTSNSSSAYGDGVSSVDEREQDHGHDVLHDQDADRDAAVHGAQLAIAFEHLRREHRAREAEADGQRERQTRRRASRRPTECATPIDAGQHQMRDRRAPHLVAQQRLDAELQADGEQQQQHAGVGEIVEHRRALHAERREHEARCEETDERRQADARDRKAQQ